MTTAERSGTNARINARKNAGTHVMTTARRTATKTARETTLNALVENHTELKDNNQSHLINLVPNKVSHKNSQI